MAVEVYPILNKEVDWESWAGEIRVNYIRLVAIALFYGQHVLHALIAIRSDVPFASDDARAYLVDASDRRIRGIQ